MQVKKLKSIIIDDSAVQRLAVSKLIATHPDLELIIQYKDGFEAQKKVNSKDIDLIFLDVEMPILDGFEFIESMENPPQIILITGKPEYALKAFDYNVTDYLLKPIDISLLEKAIKKAEKSIENNTQSARIDLLQENRKKITKIAIPYKTDYAIVNINDIYSIEADRMYSILHMKNNKKYMVAKKLSYYENLLCDHTEFIRLHRSWIINIEKIETYSKKEKEVILDSQFKVPVSKSYKEVFEALFYT